MAAMGSEGVDVVKGVAWVWACVWLAGWALFASMPGARLCMEISSRILSRYQGKYLDTDMCPVGLVLVVSVHFRRVRRSCSARLAD
ncbi:hypothetical protein IWX92DRAFT_371081 [Phyllosticta citricarpa]